MRINEAGISNYQFKLALNDRDMMYIRKTKERRNLQIGPQPFNVKQMSVIFIIHTILMGMAVFIFLIELIVGRAYKKINHK